MPCTGTYLGGCCGPEIPEGILFKRVVLTGSAYNPGPLTPGVAWVESFLAEIYAAFLAEPYPAEFGYSTIIDYSRAEAVPPPPVNITRTGPQGPATMPVINLTTANGGFVQTGVAGTPATAILRFFNINISKYLFRSRGWLRHRESIATGNTNCQLLPRTDEAGAALIHDGELLPAAPHIDTSRPGSGGWGIYFIPVDTLTFHGETQPACP